MGVADVAAPEQADAYGHAPASFPRVNPSHSPWRYMAPSARSYRPYRASALAPDHAPVIGAHRPHKADVGERPQHGVQVHATARRRVGRLVKAPLACDAH